MPALVAAAPGRAHSAGIGYSCEPAVGQPADEIVRRPHP